MISKKTKSGGGRFATVSLRVWLLSFFMVTALVLSAGTVQAFNQNPTLNWGNTTIMDAVLPPPGLYLSNYMVYYHADKLVDGDGHKLPGENKLDVLVYTPQLIWESATKIGGLAWGIQALIPIINYTYTSDADSEFMGISENNDVLGDLCIGPYIGGIVPFGPNSRLHWFFDFDVYAPIGAYNKNKTFNPSANYWTLEPFLALTLQLPYGFEIGTRQHFTYNFKNTDYGPDSQDMKAGMLWHFNYEVMKSVDFISPMLYVGAAGYYGKQLTDDELDGHDVDNSKEQKFAIGPAVWYLSKGGTVFSVRAYFESGNKATAEGDKVVARIIIPF